MINISLTTFVDFVSKAGPPKMTVVKNWKNKEEYNPASDFYKPIRDRIVEMHKDGHSLSHLTHLLGTLTDKKKETVYPEIVDGYKSWRGRKTLEWFDPPSSNWENDDVSISVNPELGLLINGKPHLIKLYFKNDPLAKNRIDMITHLMETTCQRLAPKDTVMAVLDTRRSKLIVPTVPIPGLDALIQAEAAYWQTLWPLV